MRMLLVCLLLTLPAAAKERPQYTYQDCVLQSFRTEHTGTTCSESNDTPGTVKTHTDDYGNTNGTVNATSNGSTSCDDTERVLYTVKSGDNTFVLTPDRRGWSLALAKNTVLANRLPGTALLLRADGKHYLVKIGDRESVYKAVAVQ